MKRIFYIMFCFLLIFFWASVATCQTVDEEITKTTQSYEDWTKNLAEFVQDVRFNENDVQSFIANWEDFSSFGEEEDSEEEDSEEGEFFDFNNILKDSSYLSWAKDNKLDHETWLKKSMRIMAVLMRTQIEESMSNNQFDMTAQLKELEKMRDQMGEEMYQQTKQMMEASAKVMDGVGNSSKHLPMPTDEEKSLLLKYNNQLTNIVNEE